MALRRAFLREHLNETTRILADITVRKKKEKEEEETTSSSLTTACAR